VARALCARLPRALEFGHLTRAVAVCAQLKQWVEPGKEAEARAASALAPPPISTRTSSGALDSACVSRPRRRVPRRRPRRRPRGCCWRGYAAVSSVI
jgi:hypothetical protein